MAEKKLKIDGRKYVKTSLPELENKVFLTMTEVADFLRVSEASVSRWLTSGKLRAHKMGRTWRIPVDALKEFLDETST